MAGKTLGVLGFGRIGQQVARRANGLEMRVVAYDPFVAKERYRELGVERVETQDEVFAKADFVTLHLPLTAETRGSIDASAFATIGSEIQKSVSQTKSTANTLKGLKPDGALRKAFQTAPACTQLKRGSSAVGS